MTFCDEMKQLKKSLIENNTENENRYRIQVEKEIKKAVRFAVERGSLSYNLLESDVLLSNYLVPYKIDSSRGKCLVVEVVRSLGLTIVDGSNTVTGWAN